MEYKSVEATDMRLYYGSETFFTSPKFGEGKANNDYGLGFYMTTSYDLAKLWAGRAKDGGYVLTFEFDIEGLDVLELRDYDEENVLKWISILVRNRFDYAERQRYQDRIAWLSRKFPTVLDSVDVVIGYRADDSYFQYSRAFVANELSFEILTEAMRIGKLGLQYVAISKKAFERLKFVKADRFDHTSDYESFQKRTLTEYHAMKKTDKDTNTFIRDLVRKYGD